jgi:hypothetical protein
VRTVCEVAFQRLQMEIGDEDRVVKLTPTHECKPVP